MTLSTNASQDEKNAHYRAALQAYVDGITRADAEAVLALFAEEAEAEDPVGSGRHMQGKAALRTFYENVCSRGVRMEINGHISAGKSNIAAAPILSQVGSTRIEAISVARFDAAGLIIRYDAVWGPGDIEES